MIYNHFHLKSQPESDYCLAGLACSEFLKASFLDCSVKKYIWVRVMEGTRAYRKFIKSYRKSEVIFEEDSPGHEMYVIHSGRVTLSTRKMGRDISLATLGPGEFFGEMALVDSSNRTATAIAAEDDTRLITLDQDKFLYLVGQQPAFALTIMHELCRRIRDRWSLYDTLLKEKENPSGKTERGTFLAGTQTDF